MQQKVRFTKSQTYAVTGLSINQDIESSMVAVTDTDRQEDIRNMTQKLVKENIDQDLDLRIYSEEVFEKIISFKKKTESEISPINLTLYNTIKKNKKKLNSKTIYFIKKSMVWTGRY